MLILGIETSCDETSCAVVKWENNHFLVLSNIVSSQIKFHAPYGGVVPNLAARKHLQNILPVTKKALKKAGIVPNNLDFIAVTQGPGLIPALLVGTMAAKTFSYFWHKPLLGIHHIEGHIYANFIENKIENNLDEISKFEVSNSPVKFPLLCLVVSGGHTQLIFMKEHLDYTILGETLDDAVGEAFDKVARILGLSYPGGPQIEKKASMIKNNSYQTLEKKFPRPMINSKDLNFSFSGLKTSVLYLIKKNESLLKNERFVQEVCHEFQEAVTETLIAKTIQAGKRYSPKTILLAGGVSANQYLQKKMAKIIKKELPYSAYHSLDTRYSLDNATMIAIAGFFRWEKNKDNKNFQKEIANNWKTLQTQANLELK